MCVGRATSAVKPVPVSARSQRGVAYTFRRGTAGALFTRPTPRPAPSPLSGGPTDEFIRSRATSTIMQHCKQVLVDACTQRGLASSGTMDILVSRLRAYVSAEPAASQSASPLSSCAPAALAGIAGSKLSSVANRSGSSVANGSAPQTQSTGGNGSKPISSAAQMQRMGGNGSKPISSGANGTAPQMQSTGGNGSKPGSSAAQTLRMQRTDGNGSKPTSSGANGSGAQKQRTGRHGSTRGSGSSGAGVDADKLADLLLWLIAVKPSLVQKTNKKTKDKY
ncbi:hypothetical protein FOA52_009924 [Chlamydomonas sp. UWO 241]|nr:hypothetical protein FOA52_009924 [Chlamydomonas sp. UWO 241]